MVDIHSHILPGIDDGARSWEMSLEMCRMAAEDGVTHIVATPHASDEYAYDRLLFEGMLDDLRAKCPYDLQFSLGCDFHLSFENLRAVVHDPDAYLISGTDYLLVEFSDHAIPPAVIKHLDGLIAMGITPVITHPERNRIFQQSLQQVLSLVEAGCVVQVTANSLTGFWGPRATECAEWLLRRDAVHAIASDAHDPKRRVPILSEAKAFAAGIIGADTAEALVGGNPQAIVRNQSLPFLPKPVRP